MRSRDLPSCRTTARALPPSTLWIEGDGYVAADTPSCRATNYGHRLVLDSLPPDWEGALRAWHRHHRGKGVAEAWFAVELDRQPQDVPSPSVPPGMTLERYSVLKLDPARFARFAARPLPDGVVVRPARPDEDDAMRRFAVEANGWTDDPVGRAYLDWVLSWRSRAVASGQAVVHAAFVDGEPVAECTVHTFEDEARFQDVRTASAHRGRGLATAVVASAVAHHLAGGAPGPLWMNAATDEQPERIYRRVGFERVGTDLEVCAPAPRTDADIRALVSSFEAATLPTERWHHAEHLVVAAAWIREAGGQLEPAMDRMRAALHRFLDAHGIETTPDSGYHETITRGWLELTARHLARRGGGSLEEDVLSVVLHLGDKLLPLQHWRRETLMSSEARTGWVSPDRAPLS